MLTIYAFIHNILNILSPLLLFVRFPYHSIIIVWVLCHTSYAVLIQRNPSKASTQRTCTWGFQPVRLYPGCALCWSCGASSVAVGLIPKLRNWNGFHPEKKMVVHPLFPLYCCLDRLACLYESFPPFEDCRKGITYVEHLIHWKSYYCYGAAFISVFTVPVTSWTKVKIQKKIGTNF